MQSRDYGDILGGAVLVLIGIFAAWHSWATLSIGTVSQMGPGMFPAALGCILVIFGIAIVIPALARKAEMPTIDLRSMVAALASVLVFALLVQPFGIAPAIIALTLIVSRADNKLSLLKTAILGCGLAIGAALIFKVGIDLPISVIDWPW